MDVLKTLDFISYIVGGALAAAWGALSFWRARREKDGSLLFYLLCGFYACIFMSDIYYLLAWTVEDYPFLLSPGDLSWVGALAFLITIALDLTDGWTPEQRKAAERYRLPALAAPAVCIAFNIAYISIYPDIIFNYLLYAVPTVILSYFALWLFLAEYKGGALPGRQPYHLAVLVWIVVQLFYDLFSTLGHSQRRAFISLRKRGWTHDLSGKYLRVPGHTAHHRSLPAERRNPPLYSLFHAGPARLSAFGLYKQLHCGGCFR